MEAEQFQKYIKEGEPDIREKGYLWYTAIGLQDVDGLKPTDYLVKTAIRNIEGEVSLKEVNDLLRTYHEANDSINSLDRSKEADLVSVHAVMLLAEQGFSFNKQQYLSIHKRLFEGIYPHAGEMRKYNISKKEWVLEGKSVTYGNALELAMTLDYDLKQERAFSYKGLSMNEIIHHLALFVSGLWQIHIFEEGNTRTTAVFFIKYLRTLGFDVTNDIFALNSWYFRNALVRANYNDLKNGIHETTEFLELFLRNLLLGENHSLNNRDLHIKAV